MLLRIWTLLLAIALATTAIAVVDVPAAEAAQLLEEPALDELVTDTSSLPILVAVRRVVLSRRAHLTPSTPPPSSIFRPPRLPR